MDISAGPAALGGMMMCVALASWALGRWQGGVVALEDADSGDLADPVAAPRIAVRLSPAAVPAAPCQHAAREERHVALAGAASLGELHAEITAYRRAEQVLARVEGEVLGQLHPQHETGGACRYLGVMGEPTCGISEALRQACACGTATGCGRASAPQRAGIAAQPSPFASGLTRV